MTAAPRLVQLHGCVVDLIYEVEALPRPGGEAIVTGFAMAAGGGFNAMAAAARAGMDVAYGGSLGTGPLSDLVAGALADEGIAPPRERDPARDQGCCTVLVEPSGERSFVAAEGAEGHLAPGALAAGPDDWAILSGYALHYAGSRGEAVRWLREGEGALVFDPSPVASALPPDALRAAMARALWISANAEEAAVLTGETDPEAAAHALAAPRPGGGALVRLGADGCILAHGGRALHLPGHPVRAVDTNGAGDAHLGAFVAEIARGADPEDAARFANMAAALSVTRKGPATAPTRAEVLRAMGARAA